MFEILWISVCFCKACCPFFVTCIVDGVHPSDVGGPIVSRHKTRDIDVTSGLHEHLLTAQNGRERNWKRETIFFEHFLNVASMNRLTIVTFDKFKVYLKSLGKNSWSSRVYSKFIKRNCGRKLCIQYKLFIDLW